MEDILAFLEQTKIQYLATIGMDGKPKVRPFQFMFEDESKLWFCTANTKAVYQELQKQPFLELCAAGKNKSWLRIEATAVFVNDLRIKAKILAHSKLVENIYKQANNPAFEVFYLAEATASISEIRKPARKYKL